MYLMSISFKALTFSPFKFCVGPYYNFLSHSYDMRLMILFPHSAQDFFSWTCRIRKQSTVTRQFACVIIAE